MKSLSLWESRPERSERGCITLVVFRLPFALILLFLFSCSTDNLGVCRAEPPITALAFTLDCQRVIAGSQRGVSIHDWPSLSLVQSKDCELDSIHDISVSPDGGHLLVAGGSPGEVGVVQLRSWPALDLVRSWREHQDVVYKTAWRSDGKEWVSASWDGYCRVCLPDAEASHIKMTSHSGPVFAATYLSDGSVATAGGDRTIVVWNSGSGQSTRVLRQHTGSVHALALQPASEGGLERLLASASEDRTIRFWQTNIGRMVRFHRLTSIPRSIVWTHDGRWLIAGCNDGTIVQLDPVTLTSSVLSQQEASVLNILTEPKREKLCISLGPELMKLKLEK